MPFTFVNAPLIVMEAEPNSSFSLFRSFRAEYASSLELNSTKDNFVAVRLFFRRLGITPTEIYFGKDGYLTKNFSIFFVRSLHAISRGKPEKTIRLCAGSRLSRIILISAGIYDDPELALGTAFCWCF